MTLGEAKKRVYMLLDEHSSGGDIEHDPDLERKMAAFFDIAQKETAKIRRIPRRYAVPREPGVTEYPMPRDFVSVRRVLAGEGNAAGRFVWNGRSLLIPESESAAVTVEYFAMPADIPPDAPDGYELELPEDACSCLPYYVAAQQLLADPVLDGSAYLRMWQAAVAALDVRVPGEDAALRQTLYR